MQKRKLLIVSSEKPCQVILNLIRELASNSDIHILAGAPTFPEQEIAGIREKKVRLPKQPKNFLQKAAYPAILTVLIMNYLIRFYRSNRIHRYDAVLLLGRSEKMIFTPLAKLFKVRAVWVEFPDEKYKKRCGYFSFFYKLCLSWAEIAIFSKINRIGLEECGLKASKFISLSPFIKPAQLHHQDNIFDRFIESDLKKFRKKFFTVGTILDLSRHQNLEMLFQAIKSCLEIVPNLQLIVVGEGEEKKDLAWLAKKMKIDNLVWFVGKEKPVKKWLDNFDIFVITAESPTLDDMANVLMAMSCPLVTIGPKNAGLDDLIIENKTGCLIEMDNSEMLARQIIKLYQNKNLREQLAKAGKERVDNNFTTDKIMAILNESLDRK